MNYFFALIATLIVIAVGFSALARAGDQPAVGSMAPAFELMDQNGDLHTLESYRGQWLALYFYPKDDTPGCTTEACSFRDSIFAFQAIGANVVGISVDDVASHKEFSDKYKLPFTLLADPDKKTSEDYGVLKNYLLMKIASRQSFIINPEGVIAKHYGKVNPDTHTQEVLTDLKALIAAE